MKDSTSCRKAAERQRLRQHEQELLQVYQDEWLGAWAALARSTGPEGRGQLDFPGPKPFRFIRGILAEVTIDELTVACARAFIKAPQTRLVRRLRIGGFAFEKEAEYEPGPDIPAEADVDPSKYVFLHWPYFANLRLFQLGWTSDEDYGDFCHLQCHLHGVRAYDFVKQMPHLEELYLFASGTPTDELFRLKTQDHLRVLQIYHTWHYPLQVLAQNPAMGRLTHLLLHPKAAGAWSESDEAPYIKLEGVRAVLHSPHLKKLTHLRLRLTDIGDRGCEEIVRSGALKRLKVLDLRHGCITDTGAHTLASCADLRNLELLDVSRNQLTEAGIRALRAAVPMLAAEYQHTPQDVRAERYLYEGDYE